MGDEAKGNDLLNVAEDIKQSFAEATEQMKGLITKQGEEIRQHGETSKATAEQIKAVEARMKEYAEWKDEVGKQLETLQKRAARKGLGTIVDDEGREYKSIGQMFTESDEYKDMVESKRAVSDRFEFKGRFDEFLRKDLLALGATGTTLGIAAPFRAPSVLFPQRRLRIRDLMNVVTLTNTDSVQYVRETGFSVLATTLTGAAIATDTELNVSNAVGFFPGQSVVIEADGGDVTAEIASADIAAGTITLSAQLGDTASAGAKVTSDTLAGTPVSQEKPDLDLNIALRTQAVVTIAGTVTVPRQALNDVERLRNYIDTRLIYALQLAEEAQILYGDGSEEMMPGILNDTERQTLAWSDGVAGDTRIDAVRRAITKVMLADYEPNGIVMHPNDWQEIEMAKGSDEHYIWVSVPQGGQQMLWALPVVPTRAIADGTAVVGAWGLGGTLYDREQASIRLFEQHADYAKKNLALLLAEERATVTWERPESFCEIDFDSAPA